MASRITTIYEQLLAGQKVTISFPDHASFTRVYSQLRTIKSRYEQKYLSSFDDILASDKSIQVVRADPKLPLEVTFILATPVPRSKTSFTIISVSK